MLGCRARVFHDEEYQWFWYCFRHHCVSDKFDNVPLTLRDLENHRRDVAVDPADDR